MTREGVTRWRVWGPSTGASDGIRRVLRVARGGWRWRRRLMLRCAGRVGGPRGVLDEPRAPDGHVLPARARAQVAQVACDRALYRVVRRRLQVAAGRRERRRPPLDRLVLRHSEAVALRERPAAAGGRGGCLFVQLLLALRVDLRDLRGGRRDGRRGDGRWGEREDARVHVAEVQRGDIARAVHEDRLKRLQRRLDVRRARVLRRRAHRTHRERRPKSAPRRARVAPLGNRTRTRAGARRWLHVFDGQRLMSWRGGGRHVD